MDDYLNLKHHYKVWYVYHSKEYDTDTLTAKTCYHFKEALNEASNLNALYIDRCDVVDGNVVFNSWRRIWSREEK